MDPNIYWVAPLVILGAILAVVAILRKFSQEHAREAAGIPLPEETDFQRILRYVLVAVFLAVLVATVDWRHLAFEMPRPFGPEARPGEGLMFGAFLLCLATIAFRLFCWSRVAAIARRRFPQAPLPPARILDPARLREKEKVFATWMDGAEARDAEDLRRWHFLYGAATKVTIGLFGVLAATALFVFYPR